MKKFMSSLICVAMFSGNAFSQTLAPDLEKLSTKMGSSATGQIGSASYSGALTAVIDADQKSLPQNGIVTMNKFKVLCAQSQNGLNRVIWTTTNSFIKFEFGCFDAGNQIEGVNFVISVHEPSGEIVSMEENQIIMPEKTSEKSKATIYVIQGATVVASTLLAAKMATGGDDKTKHAALSAGMASLFSSILYDRYNMTAEKSALLGSIASCTVGAAKELVDPYLKINGQPGQRSAADMKANVLGCVAGGGIIYLVNKFVIK